MINMHHLSVFSNPTPIRCLARALALWVFASSTAIYADNYAASHAANGQTDACFASLRLAHTTLAPCIGALARVPEQSIESAQVYSAMALVHARQTNLLAARNAMDAALSITVDDVIVQGNLGSLLIAEGNFGGAVLAYNAALALASENITLAALYLNRSLALRALGRYDEAAKDYDLYLTLGGSAPEPLTQEQPTAEPLVLENLPKVQGKY
jgi:tetratricopeptide (TPR) repeat protein